MGQVVYLQGEQIQTEVIETKARELCMKYHRERGPVSVIRIVERIGIKAFLANFKDPSVSVIITKKPEQTSVYVREEFSQPYKRWAVAHTLGHLFLHLDGGIGNYMDNMDTIKFFDETRDQKSVREVEANLFALSLLLPKRDVFRFREYATSVQDFAEYFSVPYHAMKEQLRRCNII